MTTDSVRDCIETGRRKVEHSNSAFYTSACRAAHNEASAPAVAFRSVLRTTDMSPTPSFKKRVLQIRRTKNSWNNIWAEYRLTWTAEQRNDAASCWSQREKHQECCDPTVGKCDNEFRNLMKV